MADGVPGPVAKRSWEGSLSVQATWESIAADVP